MITYICLLLIGVLSITYTSSDDKLEIHHEVPTVFIHGYKGTENSFGNMLNRFEYKYNWGKNGLVYYVSSEGNLYDYQLSKREYEPVFVQVIFENNRASFVENAGWLALVLRHMKETYNVDTINLVGHSMGGIVSVKYSMEYTSKEYPIVNNLITIGSPFDGIYNEKYFQFNQDPAASDLKPNSPALVKLLENAFPNHIEVLSIGSTGDIVAEPKSVRAIEEIVPSKQLEQVMIEDDELGHSALHENEQVDKLIYSFLWQEEDQ